MTPQTNGMPELKYSEETFREMYEALDDCTMAYRRGLKVEQAKAYKKAMKILAKAEGK